MKLTLMIEGSPAALAAILATLPAGAAVTTGLETAPFAVGDDDDTAGDAPAAVGQLDANGLPHDPRIHSEEPTLTTKNVWRYRRGVSDELKAQVEAELRARVGQQQPAPVQPVAVTPPVAPMPMPAPVAPPPQMGQPGVVPVQQPQPMPMPTPVMQPQPAPAHFDPATGTVQPAPVAQPMPMPTPVMQPQPVPQPQPAPVAQPSAIDFGTFMQILTQQMGQQVITQDYLAGVTAELTGAFHVQINSITDIASDPNKISYAVQIFQRDQRWPA